MVWGMGVNFVSLLNNVCRYPPTAVCPKKVSIYISGRFPPLQGQIASGTEQNLDQDMASPQS